MGWSGIVPYCYVKPECVVPETNASVIYSGDVGEGGELFAGSVAQFSCASGSRLVRYFIL